MTRVVISGGTGFIGSHLVRACLARGDTVTVIARSSSNDWRLADVVNRIDIARLDLTRLSIVADCLQRARPEVIFHLATTTGHRLEGPGRTFEGALFTNVTPLACLLHAAANLPSPPRSFVRAGSIAEYGSLPGPVKESQRETPTDPYGYSGLAATHLLSAQASSLPFRAVSARLALTYGPKQSTDFFIPEAIGRALSNRPLEVRRPNDRRDLIFVDDVVEGLIALADAPTLDGNTVINIGSGRAPTMRETAELVLKLCNASPSLLVSHAQGETTALCCDNSRAESTLGWRAKIELSHGLARTIEWHRGEGSVLAGRRRAT